MAPSHILQAFGATLIAPMVETSAAALWRVDVAGVPHVLKTYKRGHGGNEVPGGALMQVWSRTAPVVSVDMGPEDSLLMPVLEGPSLGDQARAGDDIGACTALAEVARALHATPPPSVPGLERLEDWCTALFDVAWAPDCPATFKTDMICAVDLTRELLATAPPPRPLHGDLHHDNVIVTPDGPIAFDAKGVLGEPTYELANALRNPKGVPEQVGDPRRFLRCVRTFAAALGVAPLRLHQWAVSKAALSIAWRRNGVIGSDREGDLLRMMIETLPVSKDHPS